MKAGARVFPWLTLVVSVKLPLLIISGPFLDGWGVAPWHNEQQLWPPCLVSKGSTAPGQQESQGLKDSFTPGAAKCQNKVVFVSEWFILYSADQKAKLQGLLSILGWGKLYKLKPSPSFHFVPFQISVRKISWWKCCIEAS